MCNPQNNPTRKTDDPSQHFVDFQSLATMVAIPLVAIPLVTTLRDATVVGSVVTAIRSRVNLTLHRGGFGLSKGFARLAKGVRVQLC